MGQRHQYISIPINKKPSKSFYILKTTLTRIFSEKRDKYQVGFYRKSFLDEYIANSKRCIQRY